MLIVQCACQIILQKRVDIRIQHVPIGSMPYVAWVHAMTAMHFT